MRQATACANCRKRKRKCVSSPLGHCCDYCIQHGMACSLTGLAGQSLASCNDDTSSTQQDGQHVASDLVATILSDSVVETDTLDVTSGDASSSDVGLIQAGALPSIGLQLNLASLYFDYIHDQFHSIFHKPSIMELIKHGKAPPILILGMIALSARFSDNRVFANIPPKERGFPFVNAAERLFDLHDISVTTIQAGILLSAFWTGQGDPALESVYICIASRMGSLLDLTSRPTSSLVERELNLRIWWTLSMIDVWTSNGMGLPRRINQSNTVPLPGDDLRYLQLDSFTLEANPSQPIHPSCLISEMIKLNYILGEIHELNEDAIRGLVDGLILETRVKSLSLKLDEWVVGLPEHMRDKQENLARYTSVGLGRVFVAVYCGYYHYGQLLYYQFLHHKDHDLVLSTADAYAIRCKAYSAALCEIIYASHSTPGCDVLYNMIGHVLVIASTVQIHTLLHSSSDEEIKTARRRLERNFEILLRLYSLWPTLGVCLLRLRVFHTACRRSTTDSFVMDRWMLRFLREYGRAVDERTDANPEDIPLSLEGIGLSSNASVLKK